MEHADPWDEVPRLEKQMEVELLSRSRRERAPADEARKVPFHGPRVSSDPFVDPRLRRRP